MSSAVVVSDVHIGDNSPTNWYQASVHEPRLVEVLDGVAEQAQAGEVTQLVLLGDLVDIWTYPPSVPPPTMAQIIAANPKTLGPGGALARAVQALPGAVTLMLGNHDGTLTDADVQTLSTTVGGLRFQRDGILTLTGASGRRTTFAHGHYWTMFNAPDRRSPWSTLPVGHFVTRAFAFHLQRTLKPGQTAADLKDMGSPNGFDLTAFLESLSPSSTSVAGELLDFVAREARMRQDTQIVLPGGTQVPYSAAHDAYKNLFTQWADDWDSDMTALRAALADQWGTYLAWFAQLLAIRENADLVVFGHTHQPVRGMVLSPIDYINSGYECVANPDMPKAQLTFTLVDLETASGKLLAVDPSGTKPPWAFDAPAIPPVVGPDRSSYVTVVNATDAPLTADRLPPTTLGDWVVAPPAQIAPGASATAWLWDDSGLGTEAKFSYNDGQLRFGARCVLVEPNAATGPGNDYVALAGAGDWGPVGVCPPWGHPLQIRFTVS